MRAAVAFADRQRRRRRHARARRAPARPASSATSAGFASAARQRTARCRSAASSSNAARRAPRRVPIGVVHRRVAARAAERGMPRPFVGFGGGVQLVDGRGERQRGAAGVLAHEDRAVAASPARARTRAMCARQRRSVAASNASPRAVSSAAPAPSKYRLAPVSRRESSKRLAHVRAALNRSPRARSAGRARRAPRLPSPRPAARRASVSSAGHRGARRGRRHVALRLEAG